MAYPSNTVTLNEAEAQRMLFEFYSNVMAVHYETHARNYQDALLKASQSGQKRPIFNIFELTPIMQDVLVHSQAMVKSIRTVDLSPRKPSPDQEK